ncbi:MAG: GatB/YqeY domain-containing protein [Phycisphaerales bacterium]|nr:GatB/YqeY domain-containing protein [Phycisphaerales bacterium]
MGLEQKIMEELKEAMKSKDEALMRGLRAIKAEIIKAKTEPNAPTPLTAEIENKLLQKLLKQRKESLQIYEQQNRADLAQKEKEEITTIEKFLPKQLSAEEIKPVVQKIIQDLGVTQASDFGKVMGVASKQLAGKADSKDIATVIKSLLS